MMKPWLSGLAMAIGALALAGEGPLGTKGDVIPTGTSGSPSSSLMPLMQMALAVGVVLLLLKVWLPKAISKLNKGIKGNLNGGVRIEESATFGGGTLNVVSVRGKTLLLSVGTQGVTFLADLTEPVAPNEPATFMEMVESASNRASRSEDAAAGKGISSSGDPDDTERPTGTRLAPAAVVSQIESVDPQVSRSAQEPRAARSDRTAAQEPLEPDDIQAALNRARLLSA